MSTKTVLFTGGRSFVALDLARAFYSAGFKVVVADSMEKSVSRYSRAVHKFYKIASPSDNFERFISDINEIIQNENIELIIPTCEEVIYLGKAKPILKAKLFAEGFEKLEILHNKWKFYRLLRTMNFPTPETFLWDSSFRAEGKWIIKPIYSRFAANIQVVDNDQWPIFQNDNSNPLLVQKYTDGEKFCSYSVCHEGKVAAHGVYRVLHAMGMGSSICFQSVKDQEIDDFVFEFVKKMAFTGQISFDYIKGDKLYILECNPRATSGVHLFKRSRELVASFFEHSQVHTPLPLQIFHEHSFMLWYGIKQKEIFSKRFWKHLLKGHNPLLMKGDNWILASLPLILLDTAKQTLFKRRGFHQALTQGIEYNGESA